MCTRYVSPTQADLEREWHIGGRNPPRWWEPAMYPRAQGPFIRPDRVDPGQGVELVVGQWGLIPHFAQSPKLTYSTCNARREEMATKASYRGPWARAQRCVIPAVSFDEPCWETGRNVWWSFRRADGALWKLAGLWATWMDPQTGEGHESFTMLTINADSHPVMCRMHKPDPKLSPGQQDKRSVVALADSDVGAWLYGTQQEARALLRPPPVEWIEATHG
ncbi:MAG: SOS response-associated peptidase family protein [Burkholderiaceae bacterium]